MLDFEDGYLDFDSMFEFVDTLQNDSFRTDSGDTTEASESIDSSDVKPKKTRKRRRSIRQSSALIPRLLVNDIRRSYAHMFVNTLNTSDIALFYEFLLTYSSKDVFYIQEAPGPSSMQFFELRGVPSICQLFYNKMQALPDSVHRIPDYCRVITRPDATTEIVAIMNMNATRLFDVGFEFIIPQNADGGEDELKIVNKTTNKCVGTLDGSINRRLQQLPILAEPVSMLCTVQFTMYLNEFKQIERFSMTLPRNVAIPSR